MNISETYKKIIKYFHEQGGYARLKDLKLNSFSVRDINKMHNEGLLAKIKPGLFRLSDMKKHQSMNIGMLDVCRAMPNGVICLLSALDYYDLTTFNPSEIYVAIPHSFKPTKIIYPPIKVFYFTEKYYELGIEEIKTTSGLVKIYDKEKTIIDIFRYINVLGEDIALESLKNYLNQPDARIGKLIDYAIICNVKKKIEPYIKSINLGINQLNNKRQQKKDKSKSVYNQLYNIAKETNREFNSILKSYFGEKFLYKLSLSAYKDKLILKGAMMFVAYKMPITRPTKDIDFLGKKIKADEKNITNILKEIISIPSSDDVTFSKIRTESIMNENKYAGIRVKIKAKLYTAEDTIQIDIGFVDKIVDGPIEINFPVILKGDEIPNINVYSVESAIAEKFEAIVKLNFTTSRMKDFYDILYFAKQHKFKMNSLIKAMAITFTERNTQPEDHKMIFKWNFKQDEDKQKQWIAFLKRIKDGKTEKYFPSCNKKTSIFYSSYF